MSQKYRHTICLENAGVLSHLTCPSDQFILRMHAPECAARAVPGSFIHIRCDTDIPMRRPLSIMRANIEESWIEVLYKTTGQGLSALSRTVAGDTLSILGPIGNGFVTDPERPLAIMIGGGVGIPPLVFLGERLHEQCGKTNAWGANADQSSRPVAFFGSEIPFPFDLVEDAQILEAAPDSATTALKLMEDWKIPSRLASKAGYAGCYSGLVTDLASQWMQSLKARTLDQVLIYACGPEPMLRAVAGLAAEFSVPSQLCLEEYMACGVGGCAGCTVKVQTESGPAMKRVCVDGPVFSGHSVYPETSGTTSSGGA